jgi:penicillin-binding protein 2
MSPLMGFDDRRGVTLRLAIMQYGTAVAFAVLAVAFWIFQVAQYGYYQEMAENNHQRTLSLRAPRGVLFDRHGKVMVENRYAFNISLVREQAADLDESVRRLAAVTGVPEVQLRATIARNRNEPPYRPIVLVQDASRAQVAAVAARRLELRGVIVQEVPTRQYPADALAAHLFGYVGEVSRAQLERPGFEHISSGAIVGQSGVEHTYNALLMGQDGARSVVVNSLGREIKTVGEIDPVEGRRLQLTIDYDLQKAAEEAFRHAGFWGAAIVLDPRTGEVLAIVSLPAYDPNAFATGIDRATWGALNSDQLRPLQNRAIQGLYSPGSTFKIVVAAAALEEGLVTPAHRVRCSGGAVFYNRYFQCHLKGGHGSVDMRQAMEKSCNVYFYTLGSMMSIDTLHKWATVLGLGDRSGIDLPHEQAPLMPSSAWKLARFGEKWYPGETISVAIGQGAVSSTPMSLAVMMMTVANGGTRHTPHLLKAVDEGSGWQAVPPPAPQSVLRFKPETVQALHDGLWRAVNAAGTAGRARIPGRDVAGKTGTAQVISLQGRAAARGTTDRDLRNHGWFVFFAPKGEAELAGAIFAEHSDRGFLAAPIAKHIMETYFAKQDGRPLPPLVMPAAPVVAAGGQPAPAAAGAQH